MSHRTVLPSPHPGLTLVLWSLDHGPHSDVDRTLLSSDERERMDRFVFDRDRSRFASGRRGLRRELGAAIGHPPESLAFDYGAHGRPSLRGMDDLDFNLSHTGGVALLALLDRQRLHARVGADVEWRRSRQGALLPVTQLADLARICFSPAERATLAAASVPHDVFYRTWSRKEAVIKALGDGIGYGLERFDVSGSEGARVLRFDDPHEDVSRWTLWDLGASLPQWAGDIAAAVALRLDHLNDELPVGSLPLSE